jgi:hypothetical protein
MLRRRFSSELGSATLGFALVFPLIALLFLGISDLVMDVLRREKIAQIAQQHLQGAVRLPHTEDVRSFIELAISSRGYETEVTVDKRKQASVDVVGVEIRGANSDFTIRLLGVYETIG